MSNVLIDDDQSDDTADAEGCESDIWIQHLNVRDDNAASGASDPNNGVLEIVGVHEIRQRNTIQKRTR